MAQKVIRNILSKYLLKQTVVDTTKLKYQYQNSLEAVVLKGEAIHHVFTIQYNKIYNDQFTG